MRVIEKYCLSLKSDRSGSCPTDKGNPFSLPISSERDKLNTGNMKTINLSKGFVALVDDEDYKYLNQFNWYARNSRGAFYAVRESKKRGRSVIYIWMHRVIMNPESGKETDHINHNGLDNRRSNLRVVTHRENCINQKNLNKTGYVGVKHQYKSFAAQIKINGRKKWLGTFDTAKEAHNAYMNKVNELLREEKK
jgi:hypothetical protein